MRLHQARETLRILGGSWTGYTLFGLSMVAVALLEVIGVSVIPLFIALLSDPEQGYSWTQRRTFAEILPIASARDLVWISCWGLIFLFPIKSLIVGLINWLQLRFIARREISLSTRLLRAILHRPYAFHLERSTPVLQRTVINDSYAAFHNCVLPAAHLLTEALVVALIAALLFWSQPVAALSATVLLVAFIFGFYLIFRMRLAMIGARQIKENADLVKAVTQALGSIKEVKLLGREGFFVDAFSHHARRQAGNSVEFSIIGQTPRLILEALVVICLAAAVLLLLQRDVPVKQSLPFLALFGVAALRLLPSVSRILAALTQIRTSMPAVESVLEVLRNAGAEHPVDVEAHTAELRPSQQIQLKSDLAMTNICFAYPGAVSPVLKDISCAIPQGTMFGIVGGSGAGKSTLVDVVLGLQLPSAGKVTANGVGIADLGVRWLRSVGYVPQTIYLADDTIRANVAFGLPRNRINDEAVWAALRCAMLAEFVTTLPEGLDTQVGESGSRLSGGQRQRIGIARALYGDKTLLVMDEATSALDNQTENEVGAVLQGLRGERTQIIVAHRLNTVKRCDRLLYLEQGKVAGLGSYSELMNASPEFRSLMGGLESAKA